MNAPLSDPLRSSRKWVDARELGAIPELDEAPQVQSPHPIYDPPRPALASPKYSLRRRAAIWLALILASWACVAGLTWMMALVMEQLSELLR